jgi:hypothetical protein
MEPGDQELYLQEGMQGGLTLTRYMHIYACAAHQHIKSRPVSAAMITTTADR